MKLLLRPRFTLASMVTGLSALAGMCLTTVGGLAPLADKHGLERLRPWIIGVDTVLGIVAGISIVLAAIGRSITPLVDHSDTGNLPRS